MGQFVAMLMAFYAVMRHNSGYLHLQLRDGFRPDKETIGAVFKVGFPAMVEQLVMRAGMIIYSKTVASLGTVAFATHQVCMNIQALSFMNGQAFGVSRHFHWWASAWVSAARIWRRNTAAVPAGWA